jgi:hypothetical protein
MTYLSSTAFRRALEDRLQTQSTHGAVALNRLRKMVAFDRFLARLLAAQSDTWMLKGGLALQLRLGDRARTTKDMDILLTIPRASRVPDYATPAGFRRHPAGHDPLTAQGSGVPPPSLPAPPAAWAPKYQRLARDTGLGDVTLPAAFERARQFLAPALSGQTRGVWSPTAQAWL